ncbi:hypothetical protein BDZ45DRAFT_19523 [Acephala macrosclerotiorum]|nr:hypothetical protein BDZ45DRAFT_19523 [Acephala macrosclerotiorum]
MEPDSFGLPTTSTNTPSVSISTMAPIKATDSKEKSLALPPAPRPPTRPASRSPSQSRQPLKTKHASHFPNHNTLQTLDDWPPLPSVSI